MHPLFGGRSCTERLAADGLRADMRQLAGFLEKAHPEPYQRGGGKVAFHRRLQRLLAAVPDGGMTRDDFLSLVSPFVAAVRDGHTRLYLTPPAGAPLARGAGGVRLPLGLRVIGGELVVMQVFEPKLRGWIGARLRSVAGVGLDELARRQCALEGHDNAVHNLLNLGRSLEEPRRLEVLLSGRWGRTTTHRETDVGTDLGADPDLDLEIEVELERRGAPFRNQRLALVPVSRQPIEAPTVIALPRLDHAAQAIGFLDRARRIAVLRLEHLRGYREAFEWSRSHGRSAGLDLARIVYERAHDRRPPDDADRLIAAIPSATDLLGELVRSMRAARSHMLLVDVRGNSGGNSMISGMLLYYLFGREDAVAAMRDGYQIRKLSSLYFENYARPTLDEMNAGRELPLADDDYDFCEETTYLDERAHGATQLSPASLARVESAFARMPTFHAEYVSGAHEAFYRPPRICVICSAGTRSAAFDLLVDLHRQGATVVGTPPSQAGNCFIDSLEFGLAHSGIRGSLSCKVSVLFPDDPERGEVFRPDRELDYGTLAVYGFDPHAEIRLALDV